MIFTDKFEKLIELGYKANFDHSCYFKTFERYSGIFIYTKTREVIIEGFECEQEYEKAFNEIKNFIKE